MKASLLLILLLCLPAVVRPAGTGAGAFNLSVSSALTYWPEDALVNVYFVRDMFTDGEKQTLRETMEGWTQRSKESRAGIRFGFAGETGGLIDCERCLTITRQGVSPDNPGQRFTFSVLRQDQSGQLLSAWIAFERSSASRTSLRNLMLQALERALPSDSQTAKAGH